MILQNIIFLKSPEKTKTTISPTRQPWGRHSSTFFTSQVRTSYDCHFRHYKIFLARISIFSYILMNGGIIYLVGVFLSFAFANLILSIIVLRTKAYKNIFTAFSGIKKNKEINKEIITNSFSAIVMPSAAFFSKDSFKPSRILSARQETEKKFKKFSFWNSFLFFVVGNITKSIV